MHLRVWLSHYAGEVWRNIAGVNARENAPPQNAVDSGFDLMLLQVCKLANGMAVVALTAQLFYWINKWVENAA